MIDLTFLSGYLVLAVVGVCLCLGYVIKTSLDFIPNKYIPLIMAVIGIALNVWVAGALTIEVLDNAVIKELSNNIQIRVKDAIKKSLDVEVKSLDIKVKNMIVPTDETKDA